MPIWSGQTHILCLAQLSLNQRADTGQQCQAHVCRAGLRLLSSMSCSYPSQHATRCRCVGTQLSCPHDILNKSLTCHNRLQVSSQDTRHKSQALHASNQLCSTLCAGGGLPRQPAPPWCRRGRLRLSARPFRGWCLPRSAGHCRALPLAGQVALCFAPYMHVLRLMHAGLYRA